jgi:hypothetical protein
METFYIPKIASIIQQNKNFIVVSLLLLFFSGKTDAQYIKQFPYADSVYTIEAVKEVNQPVQVHIYCGNKTNNRTNFFEFTSVPTFEVFQILFINTICKISDGKVKSDEAKKDKQLNFYTNDIYLGLFTFSLITDERTPRAGYLRVFSGINVKPNTDPPDVPCNKCRKVMYLKEIIEKNCLKLDSLISKYNRINAYPNNDNQLPENSIQKILQVLQQDSLKNKNVLKKLEEYCPESFKKKHKKPFTTKNENRDFSKKSLNARIKENYFQSATYSAQLNKGDLWLSVLDQKRIMKDNFLMIEDSIGRSIKQNIHEIKLAFGDAIDFYRKPDENWSSYYNEVNKSFIDPVDLMDYKTLTLGNQDDSLFSTLLDYSKRFKGWDDLEPKKIVKEFSSIVKHLDTLQTFLSRKPSKEENSVQISKKISSLKEQIGKTDDSIIVFKNQILNYDTSSNKYKSIKKNLINKIQYIYSEYDSLNKLQSYIKIIDYRNRLITTIKNGLEASESAFSAIKEQLAQLDMITRALQDLQKSINSFLLNPKFKVDSLQIEFNQGVLKNIIVEGKYQDSIRAFTNPYPITFTSITDYERLRKVELIDIYSQNYKINLSDIIKYIPVLHVNAEDYSPYDSVYHHKFYNDSSNIIVATREKVSQILEAKLFTDFIGFSADQPNGLIQFEISKKIALATHRWKLSQDERSFLSIGNYYEPVLTVSKLEQDNKYYYVSTYDLTSGNGNISTLDIFKYSSLRFKAINLNILNFEFAKIKSAFEINGGFSTLYTPIRDTIGKKNSYNQWGAVSGMPFIEFNYRLKPDVRYGFSLSCDLGWVYLWDPKLRQINNPTDQYNSSSFNNKLMTFQFDAYYKPFLRSESGAFFRVSNTHAFPFNNNYIQIQIGYAFNILKSTGKK